jgi:hypothetical protein
MHLFAYKLIILHYACLTTLDWFKREIQGKFNWRLVVEGGNDFGCWVPRKLSFLSAIFFIILKYLGSFWFWIFFLQPFLWIG